MAGRVNTKFVVALSAALLVLACGAAALAYWALQTRPVRWVAKADALTAQGNHEEAAELYERAVGKDRTRLEWLEKWRDSIARITPDNRARYEDQYNFYRNILRQIAIIKPDDGEAQVAYIRELDAMARSGGLARESLEYVIKETTDRLKDLDPSTPGYLTLRRYRGAAEVDRMGLIKAEEEEIKQAKEDLEAAMAGDPSEFLAAVYLARWHTQVAERARIERRVEDEAEPRAKAGEILDRLEAEHGSKPEVALMIYAARQADRLRAVETPQQKLEVVARSKDAGIKVVEAALALPAEQVSADITNRIFNTIFQTVGQDAFPALQSLVDRALEKYPTDAPLIIAKGALLQEMGKQEEAIAQLQKAVDLPDVPVSLAGMSLPGHRMTAMALQIDSAIYEWSDARDDAARTAALAKAKQLRERLVKEAGLRGKEQLLLRDAKIAFAERRYDETVAKISELRSMGSTSGNMLPVLHILAQALHNQQNFGEERRVLLEMLEMRPSLAWTRAQLGEVNLRLGRVEDAALEFFAAAELEPDNAEYQERLKTVRTAMGKATDEVEGDPVVLGLIEARRARDEQGDIALARQKLENLLVRFPDDRRVFQDLIALDLREGMKDLAISRVEEMLKKYPDDMLLKRTLTQLKIEDPVEAQLTFIESSNYSPGEKALERYKVFIGARRTEEAAAALAEAEKASPEDPNIVDMIFVDALGRKDFERARQVAQKAAKLDLDQLGGMLYQGRLQLIEGEGNPEKLAAAVRTFEEAVKRVPMNPMIRKLLAQAYARTGRPVEAVEAYKRALEGKPDDLVVTRDYINLLLQLNRGKEALEAVGPDTGILRFFPSNREMLLVWMELEGRYGQRTKALEARETMYKLDPGSTANTYALADLYLQDQKWEDVARLLDELDKREDVNRLGLANMRAAMLANQGDLEGGAKVIRDSIKDDLPARQKTLAYLAMADYYRRYGMPDEATAAMRKAKETQDPVLMEADRALGDLYFEAATLKTTDAAKMEDAGEPEMAEASRKEGEDLLKQALGSYEEVYKASKSDPASSALLAKRMSETYLRLHDSKRAKDLVAEVIKHDPKQSEDLQVLLLQGAIAAEEGERRTAKAFYDRAVTLNATNPNAFFQRAMFNLSVEDADARNALMPDVLQDLEQVTKLRPGLVTAWTRRYTLLKDAKRDDEATRVLRLAIGANPDVDDLRLMLVKDLARAGLIEEMQAELVRAANEREDEARWLRLGARILSDPSIQRYRESAELLEKYYAKDPNPEIARELLDAWLRPGLKPSRQRIQQLLAEFDKAYEKDNLFDTMLQARGRAYTDQQDLAEKHLTDALAIIKNDKERPGVSAQLFFSYLVALKDGNAKAAIDWLKARARREELPPILANNVLGSKRGEEEPDKIVQEAKALLARCGDDISRVEVLRTLVGVYYTLGKYQESADAAVEAKTLLEKDPGHPTNKVYLELLNNLAYTLVAQLNKPSEGLPYAERAAEYMPKEATVLDTLGWAYYKVGEFGKAAEVLERAGQQAKDKSDGFITAVHLGQAHFSAGNKTEARRALRKAEEFAQDPETRAKDIPEYAEQFKALQKALE